MFPSKFLRVVRSCFALCSTAWSLAGVVVDHAGAPVPDVQAHLVLEGSTVLTGADGRFSLLPVGVKGSEPGVQVGAVDGSVRLHLPEGSDVSLRMLDPRGALVHSLARTLPAGEFSCSLFGSGGPRPGLYFLEYRIGEARGVLKLVQTGSGSAARWHSSRSSARSTATVVDTLVLRKTGYAQMSVAVASYADDLGSIDIDPVARPTFSVPKGTYATPQKVTIGSATPNASIFYTLDGTDPTIASNVYLEPLTIDSSRTLKAIAVKSGWANSAVASVEYTITGTVATPTFDVPAGTYTSAQSVAITSSTVGAAIYYTIDGTEPTTSSTRYTAPFNVLLSHTVKAIAVKSGWANSAVASVEYTITGTVATPTFDVPAGIYTSAQTVVITSSTVGASIYYTKDGSDPTASATGSTFKYSTPISVGSSQTLKAIAVKTSWANSPISSAAYTIN